MRRGPLFEFVLETEQRSWILSNHRSAWLLPRLERFGIADRFERIIVSDRLGSVKPHPAALEPLVEAARGGAVSFVDESPVNVTAARSAGIDALLVGGERRSTRLAGRASA